MKTRIAITAKLKDAVTAIVFIEIDDIKWIPLDAVDVGKIHDHAIPYRIQRVEIENDDASINQDCYNDRVLRTSWR